MDDSPILPMRLQAKANVGAPRALAFTSSDDDTSPVHARRRFKRLHLNFDSPAGLMFDSAAAAAATATAAGSPKDYSMFDESPRHAGVQTPPALVTTPRESVVRGLNRSGVPPTNWNPFASASPPSLVLNESRVTASPVFNTSPNGLAKSLAKSLSFARDTQLDMSSTLNSSAASSYLEMEFEVLGKLGGGTFGTVWKVKKRLDGIHYAVKMINQPIRGAAGRERVLKEVYALAAVCSKAENSHVVRYFNSWLDGDHLFIQTELCDASLEDVLKRGCDVVSEPAHVAEMLRQLLSGLRGLHMANLVHLDIKPANIFIKKDVFKLGDLGHAAMALLPEPQDASLPPPPPLPPLRPSNEHVFMIRQQQRAANLVATQDIDEGDSRYMPRELLQERHDQLPKADIFSLGVSAYECFLKKPLPSNGDDWIALREGRLDEDVVQRIGPPMAQLLRLMMHPDPARRPSAEGLLVSGGPGGVLCTQEEVQRNELERAVSVLRDYQHLHSLGLAAPSGPGAYLKRANTM